MPPERSRSRSRGSHPATGSAAGGWDEVSDAESDDGPVVVDEVLHEEQTEFQHILVFRSRDFGVCLSLDGVLQSTERDEHIYHEFLVHVALCSLPAPARVLICGGGPGGTARETLRHRSVREVVVAEIDAAVVAAARRFAPWQSAAYEAADRVRLRLCDASDAVADAEAGPVDAILVDGTDEGVTSGRSDRLWSTRFFSNCLARLRDGGVLATQLGACLPSAGGLAWSCTVEQGVARLRAAGFARVDAFAVEVPSYGGLALFALARAKVTGSPAAVPAEADLRARFACSGLADAPLRAYSVAAHRRAFQLPAPLGAALDASRPPLGETCADGPDGRAGGTPAEGGSPGAKPA